MLRAKRDYTPDPSSIPSDNYLFLNLVRRLEDQRITIAVHRLVNLVDIEKPAGKNRSLNIFLSARVRWYLTRIRTNE